MKTVVIGGGGQIGARLVREIRALGHEAVAASPSTGVDALTGEGLEGALEGAAVVIDVSNPPPARGDDPTRFFTASTENLLRIGAAAGVRHHVVLSVVGADRLAAGAYFRAKLAQEEAVRARGVPHTIVRATQFFEFLPVIANAATVEGAVRLAPAGVQPIAAEDVARALARLTLGPPAGGTVEIAGPEPFRLDELVRRYLAAREDERGVVTEPGARYFGVALEAGTLLPAAGAAHGPTRFDDWLGAHLRPGSGSGAG